MPGEAGYKVTVKDVHKEVLNIKEDLLPKIWASQNDICKKLDKYNGLHEKVNGLKKELREDKAELQKVVRVLETTKTKEQTEAEVLRRISEEKEKVRKAEHDKFLRILKIFIAIVAVAGLAVNYLF